MHRYFRFNSTNILSIFKRASRNKYLLFLWYSFKYTSGHFARTASWGKCTNSWPVTHSNTSSFFAADSWTRTIFCISLPVMTVSESPLKYPVLYLNRRCCDLLLRFTTAHTFHFTLSFFTIYNCKTLQFTPLAADIFSSLRPLVFFKPYFQS